MTEKKNETINISVNLLNAITGYLGTKPFQEVYSLINKIQEEASLSLDNKNDGETKEKKE